MKNRVKGALCLALIMAVSVFMMAGCGGSSGGSSAPATSQQSSSGSGSSGDSGASASSGKVNVPTDTVAVAAVIIARDDLPEDEVYTLTSTIFNNADKISDQHAKGKELDLQFAASMTSVPYHPGAAKFYEEKGLKIDSVKADAGKGNKADITFGTGGESGTYYAYGGVLASYVSTNSDVTITAVSSDGSKANIEDLVNGDIQIGFAQSDVMSYAYNGERLFDKKVEGFSVVAALYMEQVQIVTTNPEIKDVSDLKGKKVSIGAAGSGVYFNAIDVLGAYGITENDIQPVYQSFGDSADSLKDGKIDAAFIVAGAPTTAIVDLATAGSVYLVNIDKEHTEGLLKTSKFYSAYTIPAGTY